MQAERYDGINLCLLKARFISASETAVEFKVSDKTLCAGSSSNLKVSLPKSSTFHFFAFFLKTLNAVRSNVVICQFHYFGKKFECFHFSLAPQTERFDLRCLVNILVNFKMG